jgi:hypothetical protein
LSPGTGAGEYYGDVHVGESGNGGRIIQASQEKWLDGNRPSL